MSLWGLAAKNLRRNKLRSALTIAGIAVAVLAFLLLRTVLDAWTSGAQYADQTRVVTRNKITFIQPLPKRYLDKVAQIPGVKEVTFASWFGGKDPRPQFEHEFFAVMAVDPKSTLDVYPEMSVPADQQAAWLADRQGILVGETLAHKLGYKVGDQIKLVSQIYPGDWSFKVEGLYHATRKSLNDMQMFFHWDYLNERLPERQKDNVGWIVSRIGSASGAADIARRIDTTFDVEDTQTLSQDEGSFAHSFLASMSALLAALNIVSLVILGIMMLILGNTVAMGTRERVSEYGVLRAIGFLPSHVAKLVIGEAMTLGLAGGLTGLLVAVGFINYGLGKWIEQNMGSMFPYFRIEAGTAGLALLLAVVLGIVAGLLPAWRSSQLKVVESLRRVA